VCKTASTGGQFKSKKAVLVRLKKGTNTIKVMVPSIKRERAMDLRGITLRPAPKG